MASRDTIAENATGLIGNTPMVYLNKIGDGLPGRVGTYFGIEEKIIL